MSICVTQDVQHLPAQWLRARIFTQKVRFASKVYFTVLSNRDNLS